MRPALLVRFERRIETLFRQIEVSDSRSRTSSRSLWSVQPTSFVESVAKAISRAGLPAFGCWIASNSSSGGTLLIAEGDTLTVGSGAGSANGVFEANEMTVVGKLGTDRSLETSAVNSPLARPLAARAAPELARLTA